MRFEIKRGDIILVDLVEPIGSVQGGNNRPCLVVQNDTGNKYSPTTIIVPFTSKQTKAKLPTHVHINRNNTNLLTENSVLLCEQPMTIDKSQIVKCTGKLTTFELIKVRIALMISLGL